MGLEEPTDDIGTVLTKGAVKLGKAQRQRDVVGKSLHINTYDIFSPSDMWTQSHFLLNWILFLYGLFNEATDISSSYSIELE
jgi:hypothetical protein